MNFDENDYSLILKYIIEKGLVKISEKPIFKLKSGEMSNIYVDMRNISSYPNLINLISKYNIILSLANNHILDFGNKSLSKLINLLDERKIKYFGLVDGNDLSNVYKYIGNDSFGNSIIFAGCGWSHEQVITKKNNDGFRCIEFDYQELFNLFEHINFHFEKPKIFLYAHYGYEYEFWPLPLHVKLTRSLIDLGYSGIFGSHTHTIQANEIWQGMPIYHGLGNFFFYSKKIKHSQTNTVGNLVTLNFEEKSFKTSSVLIYQELISNRIAIQDDNSDFKQITKNLNLYSECYRYIRLRQKNPRPILYPDKKLQNYIKYKLWLYIVIFLGLINCRALVKRILSWE